MRPLARAFGSRRSPSPATASQLEWLENIRGLAEHRWFADLPVPDFTLAARLLSLARELPPAIQQLLARELDQAVNLHLGIQRRLRAPDSLPGQGADLVR